MQKQYCIGINGQKEGPLGKGYSKQQGQHCRSFDFDLIKGGEGVDREEWSVMCKNQVVVDVMGFRVSLQEYWANVCETDSLAALRTDMFEITR